MIAALEGAWSGPDVVVPDPRFLPTRTFENAFDLVNLSLGFSGCPQDTHGVLEGVLSEYLESSENTTYFVAAAGNDSDAVLRYPAAFADVNGPTPPQQPGHLRRRVRRGSADVVQQHLPRQRDGPRFADLQLPDQTGWRDGREHRSLPLASRPPWPQTPEPSRTRGPPSPSRKSVSHTHAIECRTRTVDVNRSSCVRQRLRVRPRARSGPSGGQVR